MIVFPSVTHDLERLKINIGQLIRNGNVIVAHLDQIQNKHPVIAKTSEMLMHPKPKPCL
jgi:hypothetical protein